MLHGADGIFAVSRYTAGIARELGVDPGRIHVVPNGVDAARFDMPDASERARRFRERHDLVGHPCFATVARLQPQALQALAGAGEAVAAGHVKAQRNGARAARHGLDDARAPGPLVVHGAAGGVHADEGHGRGRGLLCRRLRGPAGLAAGLALRRRGRLDRRCGRSVAEHEPDHRIDVHARGLGELSHGHVPYELFQCRHAFLPIPWGCVS